MRVQIIFATVLACCLANDGNSSADEAGEARRADAIIQRYVAAGKDAAAKRKVLDELRLAGAQGMEALNRALDRNEAARGSTEGEARNLLLCEAWTQSEMAPYKAEANWRTIHPERHFGGRKIVPPKGTKLVVQPLEEQDRERFHGGVAEEYCEKTGPDGKRVRHGPYTLRGPNGEALEQGEYTLGDRTGVWLSTYGGQFCERTYRAGMAEPEKVSVIGHANRWLAIDFGAAHTQKGGMAGGRGSTWFTLSEVTADTCLLTTGGEIEMGILPVVRYRIPRKLGRRTFDSNLAGLDFSPLDEYRLKEE